MVNETNMTTKSESVTLELEVERVYPNPDQPRKKFDQAYIEELAGSIQANGGKLITPICVVPDDKGGFMIVAGECRWRAHIFMGATFITAVVREDMDEGQVADAAIIENLHRKDITPLEEARAFQRRLDSGLTVEELAARLGLKQAWRITERTALLRLTEPLQNALACGAISPSQAYEMSRLAPMNQKLMFDAIGAGKCSTYAELRRTTETLLAAEQQVSMFADTGPTTEEKEKASRLKRAVDAAKKAVSLGFDGNDCIAAVRVSPLEASVMVQEIELLEKALREIRLNLAAAVVAGSAKRTAA